MMKGMIIVLETTMRVMMMMMLMMLMSRFEEADRGAPCPDGVEALGGHSKSGLQTDPRARRNPAPPPP